MKIINWFEKHSKISWILTVFIAIFIFYMSSRTFKGGGGKGYLSYIYHLSIFFLLSFFLLISLTKSSLTKGNFRKNIILSVLISILYGITDEIHQYFVPGRYPSIIDVITNSVGILLAGVIYSFSSIKKLYNIEYFSKKI